MGPELAPVSLHEAEQEREHSMFGLFKKNRAPAPAAPTLTRQQLVPRIKHLNFIRALDRAGVPPDKRPLTAPLCGELLVTYAFDLPDSFMMATPGMLAQAGIGSDEVAGLALANLKRTLPAPQFFAKDRCGLAHTGDNLEATLLLVDSVWTEMAGNFNGDILVTVPRRDRLLLCDSADAQACAVLAAMTAEFTNEHQDSHALSTQVMARRDGAWCLLNAH